LNRDGLIEVHGAGLETNQMVIFRAGDIHSLRDARQVYAKLTGYKRFYRERWFRQTGLMEIGIY
jgi:hypothetical protein